MRRNVKVVRRIAGEVESWFGLNARDLPWRKTKDPYGIWISEVMLQQTQVKTVVPYWTRWRELFPDVRALATAAEEQVLKAWEGLGYYSRARNLQRAARVICEVHGGVFPRGYEEVLALPGVGRYTAGAICSIAFGEARAILDGNVARVLARLFTVAGPVKEGETRARFWGLSEELVKEANDPSALNQGLMELGATVCVPRAPLCLICPLQRDCGARRAGRVEEFPERGERLVMRSRRFAALLLQREGKVLVRKRPGEVVNGGLWEFPNVELHGAGEEQEWLAGLGIAADRVVTIRHTITRNRIALEAYAGEVNGSMYGMGNAHGIGKSVTKGLAKVLGAEWRSVRELENLPFSSAHAKLRRWVQERHGKNGSARR